MLLSPSERLNYLQMKCWHRNVIIILVIFASSCITKTASSQDTLRLAISKRSGELAFSISDEKGNSNAADLNISMAFQFIAKTAKERSIHWVAIFEKGSGGSWEEIEKYANLIVKEFHVSGASLKEIKVATGGIPGMIQIWPKNETPNIKETDGDQKPIKF